jgi:hypothetical protein
VDLEPVGPPAVAGARLGHADHEALAEPARLARRPVLLVHDAPVAVLALLDHRLVVAGPAEEALAALAGEGAKVEAGRRLVAHAALLVQKGIQLVLLHKTFNTVTMPTIISTLVSGKVAASLWLVRPAVAGRAAKGRRGGGALPNIPRLSTVI